MTQLSLAAACQNIRDRFSLLLICENPIMTVIEKAYDEMVDLFARGADTESILAFRPSTKAQSRVRYLLSRNKSGESTPGEAAELQRLGEIEHLMQLVKARARLYLDRRPSA
jgi:hypothetical protein